MLLERAFRSAFYGATQREAGSSLPPAANSQPLTKLGKIAAALKRRSNRIANLLAGFGSGLLHDVFGEEVFDLGFVMNDLVISGLQQLLAAVA